MLSIIYCTSGLDSLGRTPLHYAALYGRLEIAVVLLSNGAESGARSGASDFQRTPLHLATISQNTKTSVDLMQCLLDAKADINAVDGQNNTSLHLACLSGNFQKSAFLLGKGADYRMQGFNLKTALHNACIWVGHLQPEKCQFMEMLTSQTRTIEIDTFDVDNCKFIPIWPMAYEEKLAIAKSLIRIDPNLVNLKDRDGNLPIHIAAKTNNISIVRLICQDFK